MIKSVVTNENWQHIKGHCLYRVLFTWEGFETKTKVLWVQFCWSFKKMHAYIVEIQMIREPLYKAENNNNSNFLNVTKCQEVIYMLLINPHNDQVKYASLSSLAGKDMRFRRSYDIFKFTWLIYIRIRIQTQLCLAPIPISHYHPGTGGKNYFCSISTFLIRHVSEDVNWSVYGWNNRKFSG